MSATLIKSEAKIFDKAFQELTDEMLNQENTSLFQERINALNHFNQVGFPLSRQDDWKYCDLSRYNFESFISVPSSIKPISLDKIEHLLIEPQSSQQIIFYNGYLLQGCTSSRFSTQELKSPIAISDDKMNNSLKALNRAFSKSGVSVTIPKSSSLETPIYIVYITDSDDEHFMVHPNNLITLEENSTATIIETYINIGKNASFTNSCTNISLKKNAILNHTFIQHSLSPSIQIAQTSVHQQSKSQFLSTSFTSGGTLNRASFEINLNEPQAFCQFIALELAKKHQKIDVHLCIQHHKPDCESNTLSRGVINDRAHSAFTGKIVVAKNAAKTKAALENKNLLLSSQAEANTRPQLEIHNDDVQCKHGATIGHLDLEALFYLQSRGIPEGEAKQLLINGFISPCFQAISLNVRQFVETLCYEH